MGSPLPPRLDEVGAGRLSAPRVVRVAVDVAALADQGRELDYLVGAEMADQVTVGTMVRVPLHGRRVAAWVLATDVEPPAGVSLQPVARVSGVGPAADVVELTAWGGWRWAGRRTALLRAASPPGMVHGIPPPAVGGVPDVGLGEWPDVAAEALAARRAVVRVPPAGPSGPLLLGLLGAGPGLVVCPSRDDAERASRFLRRSGVAVAAVPDEWARAAAGGATVVGARGAAWGPAPGVGVVVVLDAHDRGLGEDRAPAWNAWVVAAERARRLDVPCVLVSPCPTLEQTSWGPTLRPSRRTERTGWPPVDIVDRTKEDPRAGLLGERLVPVLRAATDDGRVLCVLNRKGRVRLLACATCGRVSVCEVCAGPVTQAAKDADLLCLRCGTARPPLCQACGSGALKAARVGVSKVREELEALLRQAVGEVTADTDGVPDTSVVIGTEALLRRVRRGVAAVIFLDFDAELLAPRYRAAEDALSLLARAARIVGPRPIGGRIVVQTRQPDHPVIAAAVHADPDRVAEPERAMRQALRFPPYAALAELSGAAEVTAGVAAALAARLGVDVSGPVDGRWVVRAADHQTLCDALAAVGRPPGAGGTDLRVDVDPDRL